MKICILWGYSDRSRQWQGVCQISKMRLLCIFVNSIWSTVGVLGGEASCSLFMLAGVSQSNAFGVLVDDLLVEGKKSGITIYIIVFLYGLLLSFSSCTKVRRRLDKYCIWADTNSKNFITSL